ncbi:hypothetical protein, partial [Borreliella garinii]|uniref:hypothetical protein n=1 Tax=Borreliella garinii TaxID=29519 RepID=UPI001AEE1FB6
RYKKCKAKSIAIFNNVDEQVNKKEYFLAKICVVTIIIESSFKEDSNLNILIFKYFFIHFKTYLKHFLNF